MIVRIPSTYLCTVLLKQYFFIQEKLLAVKYIHTYTVRILLNIQ